MKYEEMMKAYFETAMGASTDESRDGGEPLDQSYTIEDVDGETFLAMCDDVEQFAQANEGTIVSCFGHGKCSWERAGHDLWLTRNGHGAGFWDGNWPEPQAQALTNAANAMGEVHLYIGDDGKIYQ